MSAAASNTSAVSTSTSTTRHVHKESPAISKVVLSKDKIWEYGLQKCELLPQTQTIDAVVTDVVAPCFVVDTVTDFAVCAWPQTTA